MFKTLKKLFAKAPKKKMPTYAFCESRHAGSCSKWHIRKLDKAGLKPSGGITTSSLCGHVMPEEHGWDLLSPINELYLGLACQKCAEAYRENQDSHERIPQHR